MGEHEFIWEYQCLIPKWLEFDKELNTFLTKEFSKSQKAEYEIENWKMEFDLEEMRQRNLDSGFVRGIRCAIRLNDDNNKIVWNYQSKRRRWTSLPPSLTLKCEKFFKENQNDLCSEKLSFEIFGREMLVDFSGGENGILLKDVNTNEQFQIKRIESKAGPADTSDPPHPKASPTNLRERKCKFRSTTNNSAKSKTSDDKKSEKSKKGKTRKKKIDEQADEEDENNKGEDGSEDEIPFPRKKQKLDKNKKKEQEVELEEKPEIDIECSDINIQAYRIYKNSEGIIFNAMLNQTNIQNNNNKFYLIQLLENRLGGDYCVWLRWGRVGMKGQSDLNRFNSNLDGALKLFERKFKDKTNNDFLESQKNFVKVNGKYDLIKIDYKRKIIQAEKEIVKDQIVSLMDERIKKLMQTICDFKSMEKEVRRLDFDFQRMPLGKITKEQIKSGYEALTQIEQFIANNDLESVAFKQSMNEYYTRIPHCFGMRTPPMIRTIEALKQEIELLDLLTGIEIAVTKMNNSDPIEKHYSRLKWDIIPVEKETEKYKLIEEYLLNTQGPTHCSFKLELKQVYELNRKAKEKEEKFLKNLGKRMLLWHGSKLTNWYSILAQGLRIAPPEAPVTGYMFGKGVYFADISSKSANYSNSGSNNSAFMMLSEVALGEMLELKDGDSDLHNKLPKGKHSTKGIGKIVPKAEETKILDDGIEVPCGKPVDAECQDTTLIYNEFIVYNLEQIRERFLVEFTYQYNFEL
uniref:Poly [ADP-ribose] polymerase n=1 Tax=Meloidogyne javanica TaxID=6303 RepID=A0A915LM35_MELJA